MADYFLELASSAQKELDDLSQRLFERIDAKILALSHNPRPAGCKKLKGGDREWRIRIGDQRIIYTIDDKLKIVRITRIRHRREVYD